MARLCVSLQRLASGRTACGRLVLLTTCVLLSVALATVYTAQRYSLLRYVPLQGGECYLTPRQERSLRHTLRSVVAVFEDMNVTYWLDYGTLVGALRTGDIMRHDADGDIGFLAGESYKPEIVRQRLQARGIQYSYGKSYFSRAKHEDMWVDVVRWKTAEGAFHGDEIEMLTKDMTERQAKGREFIAKFTDESDEFPSSWLQPRRTVDFMDIKVKIPLMAEKLVEHRYPFTHSFNVPYKWKCWLPQWAEKSR